MAAVPLNLRIGAILKRRLEEESRKNGQTLTTEITRRLWSTLETDERQGSPATRRVIERLTQAFLSGGELVADARGLDRANWLNDETAFDVAVAAMKREAEAIKKDQRAALATLSEQAK